MRKEPHMTKIMEPVFQDPDEGGHDRGEAAPMLNAIGETPGRAPKTRRVRHVPARRVPAPPGHPGEGVAARMAGMAKSKRGHTRRLLQASGRPLLGVSRGVLVHDRNAETPVVETGGQFSGAGVSIERADTRDHGPGLCSGVRKHDAIRSEPFAGTGLPELKLPMWRSSLANFQTINPPGSYKFAKHLGILSSMVPATVHQVPACLR